MLSFSLIFYTVIQQFTSDAADELAHTRQWLWVLPPCVDHLDTGSGSDTLK